MKNFLKNNHNHIVNLVDVDKNNHVVKLGRETATRPNFYNTMLTVYASFDHSGEVATRPMLAPVELGMRGKHRKSS
jgi:hypothetical protein